MQESKSYQKNDYFLYFLSQEEARGSNPILAAAILQSRLNVFTHEKDYVRLSMDLLTTFETDFVQRQETLIQSAISSNEEIQRMVDTDSTGSVIGLVQDVYNFVFNGKEIQSRHRNQDLFDIREEEWLLDKQRPQITSLMKSLYWGSLARDLPNTTIETAIQNNIDLREAIMVLAGHYDFDKNTSLKSFFDECSKFLDRMGPWNVKDLIFLCYLWNELPNEEIRSKLDSLCSAIEDYYKLYPDKAKKYSINMALPESLPFKFDTIAMLKLENVTFKSSDFQNLKQCNPQRLDSLFISSAGALLKDIKLHNFYVIFVKMLFPHLQTSPVAETDLFEITFIHPHAANQTLQPYLRGLYSSLHLDNDILILKFAEIFIKQMIVEMRKNIP